MTKVPTRQLIVALALTVFMVGPNEALADQETVAVQLNPLAITAISENGYKGRSVVTPYFRVKDAKALGRLCGRLPRLTDVMLIAFNETPAELGRLKEHIAERQNEFESRVESVIGTGVFDGLFIVSGAKKRGEGTELADVAGGTQTCQPIKQFPWEVAASEQSAMTKPVPYANEESGSVRPSPLSEQELAAAEAELLAEQPPRGEFPGEPALSGTNSSSMVMFGVFVFGLGGIMLIAGSYIGYQVAKIRRERRRRDRRKLRKERRSPIDRRQQQLEMPEGGDRRKGSDRRQVDDRRKADRRDRRDRRDRE